MARALDLIGDRWALLIVRELLAQGQARYSDLQRGLPGIATNLLASRLAEMEAEGLLVRETLPSPAASTIFRLTPRGEALRDVLAALGRWAAPLMSEAGDDEVRAHWLILPLEMYFRDARPAGPPVSIELRVHDDAPLFLTANAGKITASETSADADAVLRGSPDTILGLLSRRLTLPQARARGLSASGELRALDRFEREPRSG